MSLAASQIITPPWGLARLLVNPGRRSYLALAWAGLFRAVGPHACAGTSNVEML